RTGAHEGSEARARARLGRRFGRGTLDRAGGDRPCGADAGHHARAARAVPVAPERRVPQSRAGGAAERVRRARGEGEVVSPDAPDPAVAEPRTSGMRVTTALPAAAEARPKATMAP